MDFDPCLCCGKMEMFTNSFDIVATFGRFCANNLTKVNVGSLLMMVFQNLTWLPN
jgi:hypothetical protein